MLTEIQLKQIMPSLSPSKLQQYLPHLNRAMQMYGVDTMLRTAAFIAQLAHESGEFRFMEEIWGPTPAQSRYEPAGDLAKRLGNTQPGDGMLYKGRGPIQITGRFNYARYGKLLELDLVSHPELAATPDVAFSTAGLFWKTNGLNELADREDFVAITRRINGGTNGLPDRQKYFERAKQILAGAFVPGAAERTRGASTPEAPSLEGVGPLMRGFEAIAELTGDAAVKRRPRARARDAGAATKGSHRR